MESIKTGLLNFGKGFGIWFVLLLFNTRGGESDANGLKILLDIVLAIILVGNYRKGKLIALLLAILTTVVTFLPLQSGIEILLLVGITVFGWILLKAIPESSEEKKKTVFKHHVGGGFKAAPMHCWKSRNWLNPFEIYTYSPDSGINIRKGIISRAYIPVPTIASSPKVYQCWWQRLLGFCNIMFLNNYTGQQFGENILKNVRFKSAMELKQML